METSGWPAGKEFKGGDCAQCPVECKSNLRQTQHLECFGGYPPKPTLCLTRAEFLLDNR